MVCKGICDRHKALKPPGIGRYFSGQKRCQICEIFIKWDELWCPCCGYRLRTRPRSLRYKIRLREKESRLNQMDRRQIKIESIQNKIAALDGKIAAKDAKL